METTSVQELVIPEDRAAVVDLEASGAQVIPELQAVSEVEEVVTAG